MDKHRRSLALRLPGAIIPLMATTVCAVGLLITGGAMQWALHTGTGAAPATAPGPGGDRGDGGTGASATPVRLQLPPVTLDVDGFSSWALLDRRTGEIAGSSNLDAPSDTMSLIKVWLAADFLRRTEYPDQRSLNRLIIMIRDSDNKAAYEFYERNGGREGIERMVELCGLTESEPYRIDGYWSNTVVSARDVVRLGACLADGRAAGPHWTDWLLTQMRLVRGVGDFGPRAVFPPEVASTIAIKNGWLLRAEDKLWHLACLAVTDKWAMSVLLRYPSRYGFDHGRELCASVAEQLKPALP
ncbi:hypothetical protein GCM10009679_60960 [Saccharothrix algeriensis]|uniref:Serine hydrolase n=2 Tax=Catellatospora bangladeshensis TaxID=310355 RepID=A0A8J3JRL8_9ACTN|nr:hypothetical protein Cba03nite_70300 [Catellatospora bangladeshensis]